MAAARQSPGRPAAVSADPAATTEQTFAPDLDQRCLEHLRSLMGWWGMLADLSFADLLLFVPIQSPKASLFLIYGQMRPSTNQTLHREDLVGRVVSRAERPLVFRSWELGEIVEGDLSADGRTEVARTQCIPVRHGGSVVAVLAREAPFDVGRRTGELERVYVELFDRFASMIVDGLFPFASEEMAVDDAPRVSDGITLLDPGGRAVFTSPNAVNALHRMGVYSNLVGARLDELGVHESAVSRSFRSKVPVIEEVESRPDVIVLLRCIPLLSAGEVSGGVVLLRDISDLRRRDRLLLSKDATIREVHHRVKNNLQTISSLLGLQRRRLSSVEGRNALREAETRIRSIAVVHEILSREMGDQVPFGEIVRALVRMAEESVVAPHPVRIVVEGKPGELPADLATPLAVALSEILQNAVGHAFDYPEDARPPDMDEGRVELAMTRTRESLVVKVTDNGRGLPEGFDIQGTGSLGLLIVRDLVTTQLLGTLDMRGGEQGTMVEVVVPLLGRG